MSLLIHIIKLISKINFTINNVGSSSISVSLTHIYMLTAWSCEQSNVGHRGQAIQGMLTDFQYTSISPYLSFMRNHIKLKKIILIRYYNTLVHGYLNLGVVVSSRLWTLYVHILYTFTEYYENVMLHTIVYFICFSAFVPVNYQYFFINPILKTNVKSKESAPK